MVRNPNYFRRLRGWLTTALSVTGMALAIGQANPNADISTLIEELGNVSQPADRTALLKRLGQSPEQSARLLAAESHRLADFGQFTNAIAINDLALEVGSLGPDATALVQVRRERGVIRFREARYPEAVAEYEQAVELARQARDSQGELLALGDQAKTLAAAGEHDRGRLLAEQALEQARQRRDTLAEAKALQSLGEVQRRSSKFVEAVTALESALPYFIATTNRTEIAETRLKLATALAPLGRYSEAEALFREVITQFREEEDPSGEAIALGNLGAVYEYTGRYSEAAKTYEASLRIKEQIHDLTGQMMTLNNLGVLAQQTGRYRQARTCFDASLRLADTTGDPAGRAMALHNLGGLSHLNGRYTEALRLLQASLAIEEGQKNVVGAAETRGYIALVYRSAGLLAEARLELESVLGVFQEHAVPYAESETWHNLGEIHFATGEFNQSVKEFNESLRLKRELEDVIGQAKTHNHLGLVYQATHRWDEARAAFETSLQLTRQIGARAEEARAWLNLGELNRLRGSSDAGSNFRRAAASAEEASDLEAVEAAHLGIARLARQNRDWPAAASAARAAIEATEAIRAQVEDPALQISFGSGHSGPYEELITATLGLNQPEPAWQAAEQGKTRTLLALLEKGRASFSRSLSEAEQKQEETLNGRLAELNLKLRVLLADSGSTNANAAARTRQELTAARRDYDRFLRQLHIAHPELAVQRVRPPPPELSQVAPLLNDNTAILEYVVSDVQTWLFLIRKSAAAAPGASPAPREISVAVHSVNAGRNELARLGRAFRQRMVQQSPRVPAPEGQELYQLLLGPVQNALNGIRLLCVVPDATLWEIPFAALADSSGHPLIEQMAIAQVPSVAAWLAMDRLAMNRAATRPAGEILILANPELGLSRRREMPMLAGFDAIPGTERQARAIAEIFPGRAQLLLGPDATESRIKRECRGYRILHLATHGLYEPNDPMFSGLLLAREANSADDGFWEAREILESEVPAELTVLSACESARGGVYSGEGLRGLSWALFVAGCPSTLATQWAVADESTADLMIEFYRQLQPRLSANNRPTAGTLITKAEALRRAQLTLLKSERWSHPFHWAPFVLTGDGR
ncbi:MAG TPA: CHAT domain-containing protein [Verrucomicrobiota bacterium]|nr:CHAT domain-containing protein [Verrucomicrobiota bacterium]